ncbi:MAG: M48 family metallopeptidase [Zoogloeaceae bacterium]|jgi:predicted metal-dependent hydrolase|nr:M48 family metallopeptidase [Zoogloeaceae bacterium]
MQKAPREKIVDLHGQPVACQLVLRRRRSIGLTVDRRGLTIAAPLRASDADIESALRRHAAWVLEKLAQWKTRQAAWEERQARIANGGEIPWLGRACRLRRVEGRTSRYDHAAACLEIAAPDEASFLPALIRFFRKEARPFFIGRVEHHAGKLGVPPPPLFLSSAKSRWGSCNAKGEIRLSWRLLHLPPPLIDYVVAHELAHLREMNHGPRFWAVVARLYPEWQQARTEIRRLQPTLPML